MTGRERLSVVFVLATPDNVGGTERATYRLAAELARLPDLEISVLGVLRTRDEPHFVTDVEVPLRYAVDARRPTSSTGSDAGEELSQTPDPMRAPTISEEADHAVAAILCSDPPDVVVATTPALLALLCRVAPGRSAIISVEHRATSARGAGGETLRSYGQYADAVVSLGTADRAWFHNAWGDACPPLATIPNFLPACFYPRSGLTQPRVVAAGRLVPAKHLDHAVRAFASVRLPGWTMRVFGDGPQRRSLQRLAGQLGVGNEVELVPFVPNLVEELAKASILVMASKSEGQPLVALEALAAGVPIISYDCPGGIRSIVEDGGNGFLVPQDDIEELGKCVRLLMEDAELRARLGVGALRRASRFAPDGIVDAWETLLREVASAPEPRRSATVPSPLRVDEGRTPRLDRSERSKGGTADSTPWVPRGGLLLHIGPHKTGTTAIQSALVTARSRLPELGVVYPGRTPAPHGAVMSRLGTYRGWDDAVPPGPIKTWKRLCTRTSSPAETVVVSSEALCHATDEQARHVCAELRPGPVRVVLTLRALAHILPSSWQEYVKSGWTTPYGEFLHWVLREPDSPDNPTPTFWQRQDHGTLVRRWADAVGAENVAVIVVDREHRQRPFRAFEEMLGLPVGALGEGAGPENRSLSRPEAELLRRVNLAVKERLPWEQFNLLMRLGGIAHLVEGRLPLSDEPRITLPAWAAERAQELAGVAVKEISATGVRVFGELDSLVSPTGVHVESGSACADASDLVAVDAVVCILEGVAAKLALLEEGDG